MTPKEKAQEMFAKYRGAVLGADQNGDVQDSYIFDATYEVLLLAVDQLIETAWWSSSGEMGEPYRKSQKEYWQEVKREIEAL